MEDKLQNWVQENIFSKATTEPKGNKQILFKNVRIVLHNTNYDITKIEDKDIFNNKEVKDNYIDEETLKQLEGQKIGKAVIACVHWGNIRTFGWAWVTLNICLPEVVKAVREWVNEPIREYRPQEKKPDINFRNVFEQQK